MFVSHALSDGYTTGNSMKRDRLRDDPPTRIIRHEFSLRSIFSVIGIAVGLWLLVQIWQIILLLIIALILAGTLSPILAWMEQHRIPRTVALGLILVVLVGGIVGLGALVVPALVTQVGILATDAPTMQGQVADYLASIPVLANSATAVRSFQPQQLLDPLAASALSFAGAAATGVILGLTTVVVAFYLIADPQRVKGFFFALLPRRFHLRTARILLEMEAVVGGYVRGQALTSLLIGIFVFVVLWIAGTPAPLALAVFAAFADLIPFVGGVLVLAPAALATLTVGLVPALIVAVAIIAYMQVESHILIPRIYGQTLRLSPLAVLVALLIGGQLLGIIGALLALPIAASVRVLIEQLRIDLPGEQPGEDTQRTLDDEAEAIYAEQTKGVSALDAVVVATSMAEDALEEEQAAVGRVEVPIEEQTDATVPRV
jgi:predicted PurR-regulated permease PerM